MLAALLTSPPATAAPAAAPALPSQKLTISFDLAGRTLFGTSLVTVPGETSITLNLAGLQILSLAVDGTPLAAQEHLVLEPAPESRQVEIRYSQAYGEANPEAHGIVDSAGITLTGHWHPLADRDNLFALTAVVPAHFEAISEADEITSTVSGREKSVSFTFPHPAGRLNFIAGPYVVEEEEFAPGQSLFSYFFPEDQELAAEYRRKTRAYLQRYQELIGPYPYRRYSIVENRLPSGYAMPTFTLLGQTVVRLPFITETSLGHEVLHSWFGNAVRVDYAGGNWSEGLTTYLADQAFAADKGLDTDYRLQQLVNYQSYVHEENALSLRDFHWAGEQSDQEGRLRRAVGYNKAGMVFHMLRRHLGDTAFYAGLRDFYERMRHQRAGWQDLAASFAKVSGQDLDLFFSQWLTRNDIPRLRIEVDDLQEEDGRPLLSLAIRQLQEKPYELTLMLEIHTASGIEQQNISLRESETRLSVALPDYPLTLVADPRYDLMRELSPPELPPTWSRFLGAREQLVVLPAAGEEDIFAPLVEILAEMAIPTMAAETVTDKDLAGKAVLFLGIGHRLVHALFADPGLPGTGFTLDVRESPLASGQVAALISSADAAETAAAARKLRHYGRYGYLHFQAGRIVDKITRETDLGMRLTLDTAPQGVALPDNLSFAGIMEKLAGARVVYVGENHTRYEDHLLQLRVIRALFAQDARLAIGMEMFERPAQPFLDAYVAQEIDEREFLKKTDYFSRWSFDYRLYRDIINFARRHGIPVVALNQEKEVVSTVARQGGLSALSEEEAEKLPPQRDLDLPGYRQRIAQAFAMHGRNDAGEEQLNSFFQAQVIWDETMAESVADFLAAHPETRMAVIAGAGHTVKDTGIPPRVARRLPGISQAVLLNAGPTGSAPDQAEADYLFFSPPAKLPPAPLLGVMLADSEQGVVVESVNEQGKARAAGIREKDMILAIDDEAVATITDLRIIMLQRRIGDRVEVQVKRRTGILFKEDKVLRIEVDL